MKLIAVIPCYKVGFKINSLVKKTLNYVDGLIVVDDFCPLNTGKFVQKKFLKNKKVLVIKNKKNLGVGGAVIKGYRQAIKFSPDFIVKLDGDGQMNPKYIKKFKLQAMKSNADYIKGNRFFFSKELMKMSLIRLIGNIFISFLGKISTGYWKIFDFSNGYTFVRTKVLKKINLSKVKTNYFFETDLLFQLSSVHAHVLDINIPAKYTNIKSNLKIWKVAHYFLIFNILNFFKRILKY